MPTYGTTSFEQMPREYRTGERSSERSPWAIIIILVVIILFGGFWYIESRPDTFEEVPVSTMPVITSAPTAEQPLDLSGLQAAALNSAIPDFAKDF